MLKRVALILILALFIPLLAACGAADQPAATTGAGQTTDSTATVGQTEPTATSEAAETPAAGAEETPSAGGETPAGGAGEENLAVSTSGYQGTLSFWVLGYQPGGQSAFGSLMDAAVAAFEEANPDIDVEITGYTGDNEGFVKLTQAVQSGGAVDLFRLPSDILPLLVRDGLVAPIDDYLTEADQADIFPNMLKAVQIEGKHYAWPLWVPPVGMYLNVDIFEERGVAIPDDDWSYEEFVEIAKQLTFQREDGTQIYGYAGFIDPGVVNTWPFIIGDGALPLSEDNTQYTWNTPEGISGLQKLVDLAQVHKVTPPDFGALTDQAVKAGFGEQRIYAMISEPSGPAANYQNAGMNFEVRHMPIGASGKPQTTGGIGLISVAASDDKAKEQAAMDLARYLTSAQVAKDVPGFYLAPGTRASVKTEAPINLFEPLVPDTYITPIIEKWPEIRDILHPQIQKAVFGELTPEEAFSQPAEEINSILQEQ